MTSNRPYFIRALHEWILDNGMTPHLVVDAGYPGTQVPLSAVQDGRVVLNIAPRAVQYLELGNASIAFTARFQGVSESVIFSPDAVLAIYARENGEGMVFPPVEDAEAGDADVPPQNPGGPGRPALKIVK